MKYKPRYFIEFGISFVVFFNNLRRMSGAFKRFVNHPAGPRTIFFWAPAMKWSLVIAGLGDMQRPVENLSFTQNVALAGNTIIKFSYWSYLVALFNGDHASKLAAFQREYICRIDRNIPVLPDWGASIQ
jgi:hypothetical protein